MYRIIDHATGRTSEKTYTLKDAKKEIQHAIPFGIWNDLTQQVIVWHVASGWIFPYRMIAALPISANKIVKRNHNFNYHPKQIFYTP